MGGSFSMELTINNITKQYGNVTVLDDVSYRFTPGIYGILGANGAGKTTLFRIICGLMRANCGNIQYDHKDIALQAEYYRSILGFLPQDFRYYPDFTGLNFMMYIASLKGLNGKIAKKRCLDLLIQVGLDDVKNKKIRKYSGGMKQRLGIAQAMINNPEILILDEPTVGLDPKERVKFRKLISSFASEKIVLLSTHIVSDIEYIADEIIILKKGRIENTGTIRYLLKDINKCVWECLVPEKEVNRIEQVYTVSNRKYGEDGVVLRLISREKPFANGGDIKAVQGDSGHSRVDMVTDVYSHIIDEDRRRNAELFEEAFYGKKNLDPKMHDETATQTVDVLDDVDAELLAKVLANPEMKALLASLAKAMK